MQTIMLIEDDPTMLRLLQTLLEIEGYRPRPWSGNINILPEIHDVKPDIILLDVNLRGINGVDVLRSLRTEPAFETMPVIMTSGLDLTEECLRAGANAFFVKPYMPDGLVNAIRTQLSQEV